MNLLFIPVSIYAFIALFIIIGIGWWYLKDKEDDKNTQGPYYQEVVNLGGMIYQIECLVLALIAMNQTIGGLDQMIYRMSYIKSYLRYLREKLEEATELIDTKALFESYIPNREPGSPDLSVMRNWCKLIGKSIMIRSNNFEPGDSTDAAILLLKAQQAQKELERTLLEFQIREEQDFFTAMDTGISLMDEAQGGQDKPIDDSYLGALKEGKDYFTTHFHEPVFIQRMKPLIGHDWNPHGVRMEQSIEQWAKEQLKKQDQAILGAGIDIGNGPDESVLTQTRLHENGEHEIIRVPMPKSGHATSKDIYDALSAQREKEELVFKMNPGLTRLQNLEKMTADMKLHALKQSIDKGNTPIPQENTPMSPEMLNHVRQGHRVQWNETEGKWVDIGNPEPDILPDDIPNKIEFENGSEITFKEESVYKSDASWKAAEERARKYNDDMGNNFPHDPNSRTGKTDWVEVWEIMANQIPRAENPDPPEQEPNKYPD